MDLEHTSDRGLPDVIERILDKGIVINADIVVSVAGTELLGITIRAAISSFETAAKYGLEMPSGTDFKAPGWKAALNKKAMCPECGNKIEEDLLIEEGCHICGWISPRKKTIKTLQNNV